MTQQTSSQTMNLVHETDAYSNSTEQVKPPTSSLSPIPQIDGMDGYVSPEKFHDAEDDDFFRCETCQETFD